MLNRYRKDKHDGKISTAAADDTKTEAEKAFEYSDTWMSGTQKNRRDKEADVRRRAIDRRANETAEEKAAKRTYMRAWYANLPPAERAASLARERERRAAARAADDDFNDSDDDLDYLTDSDDATPSPVPPPPPSTTVGEQEGGEGEGLDEITARLGGLAGVTENNM